MFDDKLLEGYECEDPHDMTKMKEIFQAEQAQNEADGETGLSMTDVYVIDISFFLYFADTFCY
jgi:hypothetical protein